MGHEVEPAFVRLRHTVLLAESEAALALETEQPGLLGAVPTLGLVGLVSSPAVESEPRARSAGG